MDHVLSVVVQTVNYIRARGLNHGQFDCFLSANYFPAGLPYRTEVRWLSQGAVLKALYSRRCTQGVVLKALYSRRCTQGAVLKVLYSRCCSQGAVLNVLYSRCCTQGAVLKVLFSRCCTQGAVLKVMYSSVSLNNERKLRSLWREKADL